MLGTVMTGVLGALAIMAGVALIARAARAGADRMLDGWQAWDDEAFAARARTDRVMEVDDEDLR